MKPPSASTTGCLYLVPAPLDFACSETIDVRSSIPLGTLTIAAGLTHWICENAKSARAYLKRIDAVCPLTQPLQALDLQELPRQVHKKGDQHFDARPLLTHALQGHDVGLLSEAGMPAIADPGASVVRAAHDLGIPVRPLVGPISLLLALSASGLNGQNFAFVGYLPQEPGARANRLRELETCAIQSGQTQVFIETPYRNLAMLQTLLQTLHNSTRLAVSSGLCLERASCCSDSIKNWKQRQPPLDNNTPAVFAIGA